MRIINKYFEHVNCYLLFKFLNNKISQPLQCKTEYGGGDYWDCETSGASQAARQHYVIVN